MVRHELPTTELIGDSATLETDVHLWYVEPESIDDPYLLERYEALLTPSERERNRRFVFARHRHQDLVTRALVRTVLSRYVPAVRPGDWRFDLGPFGRPEIATPVVRPAIRFNLSHTDGMIVCAVTGDRAIGVDVEDTQRTGSTVEIADRFFSPCEVRELRSWPVEHQSARFFHYWTAKEAYIKARGLGLQLPLDRFTIHLPGYLEDRPASGSIRIAFDPEIDDDPASWQFAARNLTARHRLALAVRRTQVDLTVRVMRTVPLRHDIRVSPAQTRGATGHVAVHE